MNTRGWASVTDVPCTYCHVGILRWAEAGRVPGWRECDACGAQYLCDPATGQRKCMRRGRRVTARRLAEVRAQREAAARTASERDARLGREAAERDLGGSYHGDDYHAFSPFRPDGAYRRAYEDTWRAGATPAAIDVIARVSLPDCAELVAVRRDGRAVVVFNKRRADGLSGGTWTAATEALIAACAMRPRDSDELRRYCEGRPL